MLQCITKRLLIFALFGLFVLPSTELLAAKKRNIEKKAKAKMGEKSDAKDPVSASVQDTILIFEPAGIKKPPQIIFTAAPPKKISSVPLLLEGVSDEESSTNSEEEAADGKSEVSAEKKTTSKKDSDNASEKNQDE